MSTLSIVQVASVQAMYNQVNAHILGRYYSSQVIQVKLIAFTAIPANGVHQSNACSNLVSHSSTTKAFSLSLSSKSSHLLSVAVFRAVQIAESNCTPKSHALIFEYFPTIFRPKWSI